MKDVSGSYIAQEEATKKKPTELYHFWRGDGDQLNINTWYYTSGDVTVPFDYGDGVKDYIPAVIQRGLAKYNAQLEVTEFSIQVGYVENPVLQFVAMNPLEIIWVEVMRLHRDMSPLEADVIFIGQIRGTSFKGVQAEIKCVGFEFFLKMPIPVWRYQINCNHDLFDTRCGLDKETYKVGPTIIFLDSTLTELTSAAFGVGDNYFLGGEVVFGDEKRAIIYHVGNTIIMPFPMLELEDGDTVNVYPGCDQRIETCRDKFILQVPISNIVNFLGFPFSPIDNPALRTP